MYYFGSSTKLVPVSGVEDTSSNTDERIVKVALEGTIPVSINYGQGRRMGDRYLGWRDANDRT